VLWYYQTTLGCDNAWGLQQPETEHEAPKVSPYRLAAHLASAFSIYAVLLWTALSLAAPISELTAATPLVQANATRLRNIAIPLSLLIAVTAGSGDLLGFRE
jgi:cytochrome c oxidase assembly protein subunit 15